jgi:hypothetical protein
VATAVALGSFLLAVAGPLRSHWNSPDVGRTAVLSVVVWPLLTGVPAFLITALARSVLRPSS